ncbi:MAG: hypothetical protein ACI89T_000993 [Cognaticolwellia sp.]|jgi:hypothetical protein
MVGDGARTPKTVTSTFKSVLPPPVITGRKPAYCHQFPGVTDLNCLPVIDVGEGKILTASASKDFMEANYGNVQYAGVVEESGIMGNNGEHVELIHDNAVKACEAFNAAEQYDRTNWRQPILKELSSTSDNMYEKRGWQVTRSY